MRSANGPQLVRIERIPDTDFEPGDGPLGTELPQYPLFFHYFTSVQDSFNLPVRIGVCNVEDPAEDSYHPDSRMTTALAMGETGKFRILPSAPARDILGDCSGATRQTASHSGALASLLGNLATRLGRPLAEVLLPTSLHATGLVVDGGMGGSTQEFSPAGTVDTGSAATQGAIDLSGVSLPAVTVPLGQGVLATVTLRNSSLITVRDVRLVASIEQGSASRAAGTASVACGDAFGSVPPGTCTVVFSLNASNSGVGSGTLVIGAATARFELQRNGALADVVSIPVTLTGVSTLLGF